MSLIELFFGKKTSTASTARDRLHIVIAQERMKSQAPDYLPDLERELLQILSKYVAVSPDAIRINHEKQNGMDVLELNITLSEGRDEQGGQT